ncbi:hypothetical protein ATY79_18590 [Rhizobium sp. R693]|nr:hypothetical protein ATY79_18590 [Rhizobium sp. R693]
MMLSASLSRDWLTVVAAAIRARGTQLENNMIRRQIAQAGMSLSREEIDICQRAFYNACAEKRIRTRSARQELALSIIARFQRHDGMPLSVTY